MLSDFFKLSFSLNDEYMHCLQASWGNNAKYSYLGILRTKRFAQSLGADSDSLRVYHLQINVSLPFKLS